MRDSADIGPDGAGHPLPLWARRIRAVWRKASAPVQEPLRRGRKLFGKRLRKATRKLGLKPGPQVLLGRVDWAKGAQVGGWAIDRRRPGRRVHVIAWCGEEVAAETLADQARGDLLREGHGDGRHGFVLQLPPGFCEGAPRRLRIEALTGQGPRPLPGGELMVGGGLALAPESTEDTAGDRVAEPDPVAYEPLAAVVAPPAPPVALLILGDGPAEVLERTAAAWRAQAAPAIAIARAADADLPAFAAAAHTVLLARPGDRPAADAAQVLARARPLGDVITWDDPRAPGGARPEARALGLLLGESLGGALAVRGPVLAGALAGALAGGRLDEGGLRALELRLAADRALRWAHAPAPLLTREGPQLGWTGVTELAAAGLDGFAWRAEAADRAGRLVPSQRPERITLAVWPSDDADWLTTVAGLVAAAPEAELEVLAPPPLLDALRELGRGRSVEARPIDPPAAGGAGGWLSVLGDAASGEVVLFCRAGVTPPADAAALEALGAWALSPFAGAATLELAGEGTPLAGLALERGPGGWRTRSAHDGLRAGQSRPVLAASGLFMAVARARLAALGGVDELRFPHGGADLDLALRLRRTGAPTVLLGDWTGKLPVGVDALLGPEAFAGFEAGELAAAADAFRPAG